MFCIYSKGGISITESWEGDNISICEFEGFNKNMSVKYFIYINDILAKALPDRLERCYLCSNSRLVKIFMGMIWDYIDKDTREKFTLCKNSEKFEM